MPPRKPKFDIREQLNIVARNHAQSGRLDWDEDLRTLCGDRDYDPHAHLLHWVLRQIEMAHEGDYDPPNVGWAIAELGKFVRAQPRADDPNKVKKPTTIHVQIAQFAAGPRSPRALPAPTPQDDDDEREAS